MHDTAYEATVSSCIQEMRSQEPLDTVNVVTKSADMSVEVLTVAGPTGVDISSDSRASSLPIGYSSHPSGAEARAPAACELWAHGG